MQIKTLRLSDDEAMRALGAQLAALSAPGDFIALKGGLGAGKTTFARGFIQALMGDDEEVPSPTYTLLQTYGAPDYEIWHADLYRLQSPDDARELGLLEPLDDVVVLLEWPEKLGGYLPQDRLDVEIIFDGTGRTVHMSGGPKWRQRLDEIE